MSGSWVEAAVLALTRLSFHLRSVWDLESGELKSALKGHTGSVNSVCATDKHIISGSDDSTVW